VIGWGDQWAQEHIIGVRIDDDAMTNKEVFDNAMRQVHADVEHAMFEASAKHKSRCLINNIKIKDRVLFPEKYDRDGK
jgi:hypothetical protein